MLSYPTQLSAKIPPQPQSAPSVRSFKVLNISHHFSGTLLRQWQLPCRYKASGTKSLSCCRPI